MRAFFRPIEQFFLETTIAASQRRLDIAMLLLRVSAGLLLACGHGLMKYNAIVNHAPFPDPLGIGPQASAICAMGAECLMSLFVAIGLWTRLSTLPILFTMTVIAILVHADRPWFKHEPSVLYLLIYATILLLGPGRYAVDRWFCAKQPNNVA